MLSLGITLSLVMPNSDPQDELSYPHLTPLKDSYNLQPALLVCGICQLSTFPVINPYSFVIDQWNR